MSSPRQFVEAFLHEKAAAYAEANVRLSSVHGKYFGNSLLQHAGSFLLRDPSKAVVEDVKQSSGSAIVITREPALFDTVLRQRYHLSPAGDSWRITSMDSECFLCRGTGRVGEAVCPRCHGELWEDTSRRITKADIERARRVGS